MVVSQLLVRTALLWEEYSRGITPLDYSSPTYSFSFQWSIICSAKENEEFIYIIQMIL